MLLVLRLGLGAVSYAAGTPGGLFAPMLVLGAQLGLFFALLSRLVFPDLDIQPAAFAVIGMAALFTGIVRTPLTGIVLVVEMTASVTMLLPMLGACFVAMLVPALLRDPPIYDSLRERLLRRYSIPPRMSELGARQLARRPRQRQRQVLVPRRRILSEDLPTADLFSRPEWTSMQYLDPLFPLRPAVSLLTVSALYRYFNHGSPLAPIRGCG